MRQAAVRIRKLGARAALIKGGHLSPTIQAIDVLEDEARVRVFRGEWIDGSKVRGTGCILSSAIAATLAMGSTLEESVRRAKEFVTDVIRSEQTSLM